MKKTCALLNLPSDDFLFRHIRDTFRNKLTTFDYFVNWKKVFEKVNPIEQELNLLNVLIGKDDVERDLSELIKKYPCVVKAFPSLVASRDGSFDILVDVKQFLSKRYDFTCGTNFSDSQIKDLVSFVKGIGLIDILKDRRIKNLMDYMIGVEVGLDSNGRKNRGGTLMENIVEVFVEECCKTNHAEFIAQANADKIKARWGKSIQMDKSSRIIDFAILKNNILFFTEVNFYNTTGSKLKSTATEYCEMYNRYRAQNVEFVWVTDGAGWQSTLSTLREYFDKTDYLLNLRMLQDGVLKKIVR